MKESIADIGLLQPIVVTEDKTLVAGLHRMTACVSLGWEDVPVTVLRGSDAVIEMAELDENLMADRGTALERAKWLARRKELYLVLHPETRRGGDKGNQYTGGKRQELPTAALPFSVDAAAKIGKSKRTVDACVQIGNMPVETLEALRGSEILQLLSLPLDVHPDVLAHAADASPNRAPPGLTPRIPAQSPAGLAQGLPPGRVSRLLFRRKDGFDDGKALFRAPSKDFGTAHAEPFAKRVDPGEHVVGNPDSGLKAGGHGRSLPHQVTSASTRM